jgi:ankyrin repeat protein
MRSAFRYAVAAAAVLLSGPALAQAADAGVSPLVQAAKAGDAATVRRLLATPGVPVNAAEADGTTALHWAVQHGQPDVVKALIRARAEVNRNNRYGVAPLWLAATNGDDATVELLLRAGADARMTRGDSGESVLMTAAMAGAPGVVQRLLAYGADPNTTDAVRGQTALMWAAAEGHAAAARVLVETGADLEAKSSTGITPLMFAIRAGHIDTTLALLDLGANLKALAPDGTTNIGLAIINAHWELAAALLDRGADANTNDPRGRPLHLVTYMRRAENRGLSPWMPRKPTGRIDSIDLAKKLIAKGGKVNDRLDYKNPGYNPTHMAVGYFQTINWQGATPFYIASKNCDLEFMKFLLDNGADAKIGTTQNVTPLLAAAGVGYAIGESPGTPEEALEAVKMLAKLGNDVNAVARLSGGSENRRGGGGGGMGGWDGATALHGAVIRGAKGLVEWLIAQNIPLDVKGAGGQTALEHARGSSLGVTFHVQPELAEIIEKAMRAKGLEVPEYKYTGNGDISTASEQGGSGAAQGQQ